MTYLLVALMAVMSGIAYHLGGLGADGAKAHPKWPAWLFSRQIRILVCPALVILSSWLLGHFTPWLALCWGLMVGATSTYWNFLHKQIDKTWWNWALHGFMIGMSMLPFGIATENIIGVVIYALALSATMLTVSEVSEDAFIEEFGRGALMVALTFLLGIHG